jgi:predicted phage baseplate assembly protein
VLATASASTAEVAVAAAGTAPALQPPLRLHWDLITVTRGESVRNEQLGIGDATLPGQDFKLTKSPVTYLADGTDPGEAGKPRSRSGDGYSSTVELIVDGIRWTEVPMLFGRGPRELVFATYEDEEGKTHVVTGDGVAGERLRSGARVSANYRIGSGAAAPASGDLSQVLKPVPSLAGVRNPVPPVGGSDPDASEKVRSLAPRSVLTFGRAVSHDDYAAVAALAPGVARAAAAWSWDPEEQRALVRVWVGDDDGAVASARTALREQADPNRPIVVLEAAAQPTTVRLSLALDPAFVPEDVVAAVRESVTALFAPGVLAIGEPLYRSRLEASCDLPGVLAVHDVLVGYMFDFFSFHFDLESPGPRWFPPEGGYFDLIDLHVGWEVAANA